MDAKRLIYFDLDNTAINSKELIDKVVAAAEEHGISREEYIHSVEELEKRYGIAAYSFERLFTVISENKPMIPWEFLKKLEDLIAKNYFYPDTIPFLSGFKKDELILITEGSSEHQLKKVMAHGLHRFVSRVVIAPMGKENAINQFAEKTFLLDDAPRAIDSVKKKYPSIVSIQMRTPPFWEKQKFSDLKDAHCKDLYEAADFIKKYKI